MNVLKDLGVTTKFLALSITLFSFSVVVGCYFLLRFDVEHEWDKVIATIASKSVSVTMMLSQQKLDSNSLELPTVAKSARLAISLLAKEPSVICAGLRGKGVAKNRITATRHTEAILCDMEPNLTFNEVITFPIKNSDLELEIYITDAEVQKEALVRSMLVITVSALSIMLSIGSTLFSFRVVIGARLKRLRKAMFDIRITGERKPIAVGPNDEIGVLVREFNTLVQTEEVRREELRISIDNQLATQKKLAAANDELKQWIATSQSERRFQDFASASSDCFWEMDSELKFTYVSAHFSVVTGLADSDIIGQDYSAFSSEIGGLRGHRDLASALGERRPFRDIDLPLQGDGEEYRWMRLNGIPVFNEDGSLQGYRGTGSDCTNDIRARDAIREAAYIDHVTGLPNRLLLIEHLKRIIPSSIRRGTLCAVLFLDLDNFKIINDTWGHSAGDDFLRTIAERLKRSVRPSDVSCRVLRQLEVVIDDEDLIARLGGDEFVVVLTDLDDAVHAERVARRISKNIQEGVLVGEVEMKCSASIGISLGPHESSEPEDLLKNADAAMYRAKGLEPGSIQLFTPALHEAIAARSRIEKRLRTAIDHGALSLYFQPRYSLESGLPVSAEALLRWEDEELGKVSPNEFIPIAEESLLMVEIGAWVLEEAIAAIAGWKNSELSVLSISVNLSAVQARDNNLAPLIASLLSTYGVAGNSLEIELTERVLMTETDEHLSLLTRMREWGIDIALDDFGTGYSSVKQLRLFPISTLKVDKSFVDGLGVNHSDESIVAAMLQLAKSLGLNSVAEGVETEVQVECLKKMGCVEAQGYLYSRPLEKEVFEELMLSQLSTHC